MEVKTVTITIIRVPVYTQGLEFVENNENIPSSPVPLGQAPYIIPTQAEAMADGDLVSCCGTKKVKPSIFAALCPRVLEPLTRNPKPQTLNP